MALVDSSVDLDHSSKGGTTMAKNGNGMKKGKGIVESASKKQMDGPMPESTKRGK